MPSALPSRQMRRDSFCADGVEAGLECENRKRHCELRTRLVALRHPTREQNVGHHISIIRPPIQVVSPTRSVDDEPNPSSAACRTSKKIAHSLTPESRSVSWTPDGSMKERSRLTPAAASQPKVTPIVEPVCDVSLSHQRPLLKPSLA